MISALPKLKQALANRADLSSPTAESPVSRLQKVKKTDRADLEKLSQETGVEIKFEGNPEDRVIVFDLDETLIFGDKEKFTPKLEKQINAMGDRKIETIPANHKLNKLGKEIKYGLVPGAKEMLEILHSEGYKMIASTRNLTLRGQSIVPYDPVLSKYISGVLGKTELESAANKDFKKYPKHCDNLGFVGKAKGLLHTTFIYTPKYLWAKIKSPFTGAHIRFSPEHGSMGKYPPMMIDLLKSQGNNNFDDCMPARILVDNSAKRELRDSLQSKDWAYVNCNVDHDGDGKSTSFRALDNSPKVKLTDPNTGEEKEGYEWVKNVYDAIHKGWKEQYKSYAGKEPKV